MKRPVTRPAPLFILLVGAMPLSLSGCGSGSTKSASRSAVPTAATRAQIAAKMNAHSSALNLTGFQSNVAIVSASNGTTGASGGAGGAAGSARAPGSGIMANIGAYFKFQLFGSGLANHGRAYHAPNSRRSRDGGPGADGGPGDGFDEFLGYYQTVTESAGKRTVALFTDVAKSVPAGSITMTFPTDLTVFPQIYDYSYQFTAGFMEGTSGSYHAVTNSDFSGSTTYRSTYSDVTFTGSFATTSDGSSTWTSREESGSSFSQFQGSFKSDGSGVTSSSDSDGYKTDFTYNADGSYRGTIDGPDPGLPAVVTFTVAGVYTIKYADGSIETHNFGFWSGGGGGVASPGTVTNASSATVKS